MTKHAKNALFVDLMTRLDLTEAQAAAYFAVPVYTFRKWLSGERAPSASVLRLVEIMGMVEALAPGLHEALMPDPVARRRPKAKGPEAP